MKKMKLRPWVKSLLIIWTTVDMFLVMLYLYALRMIEIGWV